MLTRQQIADLQGLGESTTRETIHTVLARIGASELCDLFRIGLELAGVDFGALLSESESSVCATRRADSASASSADG